MKAGTLRCCPVPRSLGVTLVELIAFIVIAGIVAVVMFQTFSGTMRGSHLGKEMTQATQLAQQRMEVIAGQRAQLGFAGFTGATYDPCPPVGAWVAEACTTTTNYSVATTFNSPVPSCDPDCKEVTITVTGANSGTLSILTMQFWNY